MRGGWVSRSLLVALLLSLALPVWAADPTLPPPAAAPASVKGKAPAAAPLRLQAILRGQDGVRAVINGQTLRVGDRVAGARVLAIGRRTVSVERQGRRFSLSLLSPLSPSRTTP